MKGTSGWTESLKQEESGLLSTFRLLMAKYKETKAPRYKQKASEALDEAQKRRDKITELERVDEVPDPANTEAGGKEDDPSDRKD
jgi:hypothetical protein